MSDVPIDGEPTAEELFARNMRQLRERKGWSQSELARLMTAQGFRWYPATVYSVEKGERKIPLNEAVAVARLMSVSVDILTQSDSETQNLLLRDRLIESFRFSGSRLIETSEVFESQRAQILNWIAANQTGHVRVQMGRHVEHMVRYSAADLAGIELSHEARQMFRRPSEQEVARRTAEENRRVHDNG